MKKILFVCLLLAFQATFAQKLAQFSTATDVEQAGFSAKRLARIDAHLQQLIDRGIAPNAVTFIARKGKIVHHKAFGYRNLEQKTPLQKDDIFRIASQTKALTSVAVMMLYEEGRFLLEEPVSKYIPAFKNPRVLESLDTAGKTVKSRPAKSEITIRQLLTHTAGIPYEHQMDALMGLKIPYIHSADADVLADVVSQIAKRPLLHDPGQAYTYGLNTDVLGYLVEVVSGVKLDVFFRQRILDPLGMKDTYFYLPDSKANRLVELYAKPTVQTPLAVSQSASMRNYPVSKAKSYFSGGAGLVSTIGDYAKFCQMILNYGEFNNIRLLGRKTVEMMTRNQIGGLEVWERQDKFGLGFQVFTDRSLYGDQATVGAVTWGGAYCSEYTIDAKEELICLVFTNVLPYAQSDEVTRKFRVLVYQALK